MPKQCLKDGCSNKPFSGGYCLYHYKQYASKKVKIISDRGLFKREENTIIKNNDLEKWFGERRKEIILHVSRCWECNAYIALPYIRHATAHLWPKSIFKSISTHPLNYVCLGAGCGCHSKFDASIDNAKKMKIWPEVVERYEQFKHLITENHKYKNLFEEAVKEYNKNK